MKMRSALAAALLLAFGAGPSCALDPSDLDKPLASFVTDEQGDFVAVCRALRIGCGVEVVDGVDSLAAVHSPLPRSGRTAREILDEYVAGRPHDDWALVDGVLNLRPAMRPTPDWLSKKIGAVAFRGADGLDAARTLLHRSGAALSLRIRPPKPLLKPVDLALKDVTVRQGLNALAKADGEFIWVVVHSKIAGRLVFRPISFRQADPGTLNDLNSDALRVSERPVR